MRHSPRERLLNTSKSAPLPADQPGVSFFSLPALLLVLTVTTGLIDAVSVLGLGRVFTANMTGNIVFLGFALAGVPGFSRPRSLAALAAFLVGAVIGGRLGARLEGSQRRWLCRSPVRTDRAHGLGHGNSERHGASTRRP